jgi:hypothetical protein
MIDLYLIAAASFIGLVFIGRIEPAWFRIFVPYLFLTLALETAVAFNWMGITKWSNELYNAFTVFEFCFYFYVFYRSFKEPALKKAVLIAIPVFLIVAGVNIFFIEGTNRFHTISYRIATVAIAYFCYRYFKQLLEVDKEINIVRTPMFWVSAALLFFYAGFFFYFTAFDYLAYTKSPLNLQLWRLLSRGLNIFLYSLFLIAIICNLKPSRS